MVCLEYSVSIFKDWCGFPIYRLEKKLWMSVYFVIIWNIWRVSNRILFEGFKLDWSFEIYRINLNLSY